jgi:cytochrome c peroxidase
MFFSALRVSARRLPFLKPHQLRPSFRKFSTPPPPPPAAKSNAGLYTGLGLVAVGSVAFYVYTSESGSTVENIFKSAKTKAVFKPTKEDYQKVGRRVMRTM